jgi:hypothetical protein
MFTAAVVEADADADVPWLATAYVPAPSLRHLVRQSGPLPPGTVRWLAAGCAEALESIHGAGLVHLDLKPSNVLIAADGPRVIDFGVARAATRIGFAKDRGAVGTPAYMAPEQARDVTEASAASDVFSLGGTLLFAATGHPPYAGETTADILVRLATEPPDLSGLPEELTDLVGPCLDRSPRQRPSSAALLARLGSFTEPQSYLPEPALALIREYQRTPRAAGERSYAGQDAGDNAYWDDEQTAESYPGLPASARPDVAALSFRSWRRNWRRALRLPTWAGWAAAGAALVAGGVILGASLTSSGSPAATPGTAASGSAAIDTRPPPVQLGPACGSPASADGAPALCVNQPEGGQSTVFAVQGSGFKPGAGLTLTLVYYPPPPLSGAPPKPRTMRTLNVTANGQHRMGPVRFGPLQLGLYRVVASGSGTSMLSTAFRVDPGGPAP